MVDVVGKTYLETIKKMDSVNVIVLCYENLFPKLKKVIIFSMT